MIAGVPAAFLALSLSTAVLYAAKPLGIDVGGGALRELATRVLSPLARDTGLASAWQGAGLPGPRALPFRLGFRYASGLGMSLLYVFVVEPLLPGRGLVKGALFAAIPWLANSFVVFPLLGAGLVGLGRIPAGGAAYFAVVNWTFGIALGMFYAAFHGRIQAILERRRGNHGPAQPADAVARPGLRGATWWAGQAVGAGVVGWMVISLVVSSLTGRRRQRTRTLKTKTW